MDDVQKGLRLILLGLALMFVGQVIRLGAVISDAQEEYQCRGQRDCEQLAIILRDCPAPTATDEVPSWVSDNDLELTGELNDR